MRPASHINHQTRSCREGTIIARKEHDRTGDFLGMPKPPKRVASDGPAPCDLGIWSAREGARQERTIDGSWNHHIYANPFCSMTQGHGAGEADDCPLAGEVCRVGSPTCEGELRPHEYDCSPNLLHGKRRLACPQESARKIGSEHCLP